MVDIRLDDIPPFDEHPELAEGLFIPDIWGPLPYLEHLRDRWRAWRQARRDR